ncbi:hypothetical protein AC579_6279 [Pseudocercospora musae]|uniref:Uncharacterized protein n=1 Tax=Pseudocercospora musae TaxID=113226 RepID=A0A139IPR3_9PEZI|nr:hypothetical protein AC579_6279 [Pseudocercospora musae]
MSKDSSRLLLASGFTATKPRHPAIVARHLFTATSSNPYGSTSFPTATMAGRHQFQPYAILPVLVTLTAFILSFLCVFAGNKPGMMDDYAVFTLNVSRIGQNAVNKIDEKIMGFNISKIVSKRSLPAHVEAFPTPVALAPRAEITLAPELDIALMARDIDSLVGDLTEGVASLKSEAGGKITSVQSAIGSKATAIASGVESGINSIEALAASKISSALNSAQTSVVEAINDTYMDFIEEMHLSDFYAIHLRTTCLGEYVMPNGTNVTIGVSAPPPNGTEKHIVACDQHSNLNPLIFIRMLYYISIICLGLALLLSIWSVISFSRKKVIANVIFILPALGFLALASVSSHGIAIGAAAVLNFLGDGIGIQANKGGKFIALTWATTILVLVNLGLWVLLFLVGEHLPGVKDRLQVREKEREMERESHELPRIRHLGTSGGEQEKRSSAPWPFADRRVSCLAEFLFRPHVSRRCSWVGAEQPLWAGAGIYDDSLEEVASSLLRVSHARSRSLATTDSKLATATSTSAFNSTTSHFCINTTITMQHSKIAELIGPVKASRKKGSANPSPSPSYISKSASRPTAAAEEPSPAARVATEKPSSRRGSGELSKSDIRDSTSAPVIAGEPSSGTRVANIAELLEQIFIFLDLTSYEGVRTLLVSQRTSRFFHATVNSTPSLQRALHFSNSNKRWSIKSNKPQRSSFFNNDRSIKLGDPFNSELAIDFAYEYAVEGTGGAIGITVVVRRTGKEWYTREGTESKLSPHFMRQSWRRMYLFEDLGLVVGTVKHEGLHEYEVKGYWKNPTLGEVFDLLYSV